mmetsp:Transcript_4534/g.6713  ORF Transcript_4534/g.6713 Transcript_4534/m.6713 type:complete len:384 (-) Transcript_4534:92-1243(-)
MTIRAFASSILLLTVGFKGTLVAAAEETEAAGNETLVAVAAYNEDNCNISKLKENCTSNATCCSGFCKLGVEPNVCSLVYNPNINSGSRQRTFNLVDFSFLFEQQDVTPTCESSPISCPEPDFSDGGACTEEFDPQNCGCKACLYSNRCYSERAGFDVDFECVDHKENGGVVSSLDIVSGKNVALPAEYTVTFQSLWSSMNHPPDYPSNNAHWSNIVAASHAAEYSMWWDGGNASQGVIDVAERGSTGVLKTELEQNSAVKTSQIIPNFSGSSTFTIQANASYPLVSLISMIAPSPDWFAGLYDLKLISKYNQWLKKFEIDIYPYDSGSDSGTTYTSANAATSPTQPIYRITNDTASVADSGGHVFVKDNDVLPVARLTFELI